MKRVLSSQHQARVDIESLADGHDFSETLTRARFEEVRRKLSLDFIVSNHFFCVALLYCLLGVADDAERNVQKARLV